MSPLSARQLEHIAELSQKRRSATHFSPLDEQISLARLAATGDAKAFKKAMDAQPEVDPGLAVAWAAENGELKCLRLALARFAPESFHPFAAALAAHHGHDDCLYALVAHADDAVGLSDTLRSACAAGQASCLAILLMMEHGPNPDVQLNFTADPGGLGSRSAMDWAVESGSTTCQLLLLEAIARISPTRALILSARHGLFDMAQQLISSGSHDTAAGHSEALYEAAKQGHADCVTLLIPVSNPHDQQSCALRFASANGHDDCVSLLIPHSNAFDNHFQSLLWACLEGHDACVDLLLGAAKPDAAVAMQCLSAAIAKGYDEIALMIIERIGGDFSDDKGNTPLHLALAKYAQDCHSHGQDDDIDDYPADFYEQDMNPPQSQHEDRHNIIRALIFSGTPIRSNHLGLDPIAHAHAQSRVSKDELSKLLSDIEASALSCELSAGSTDVLACRGLLYGKKNRI